MKTVQDEVDERSNLTGSNKLELLLFQLGGNLQSGQTELFGINVFKVREIVSMPKVTAVAGTHPAILGVVNLRGQVIQVIDLPSLVGCKPVDGTKILLVTEFARTTQGFAVESVEEIVRLDWNQVMSAESSSVGGLITSIARLENETDSARLAQILDVETILRQLNPPKDGEEPSREAADALRVKLPPGTVALVADDSLTARKMLENGLNAMGVPFIMAKTGKEAWEKLQAIASGAEAEGKRVQERIALVLTDLEMPEMDGFTLTKHIKENPRYAGIPVVIHSSLSGTTNEQHVRNVGADGYVAKFVIEELAATMRNALRL